MNSADFEVLEWDSKFFGFKIGRAAQRRFNPGDRSIVEEAKNAGLKCLYFLVDAESAETLAAMHSFGCKYVDGRLCLSRKAENESQGEESGNGVGSAQDSDESELVEICESIDWDTRFTVDSGFPTERSRLMYSEWISRDLRSGNVLVVSDENEEKILGFLSFTFSKDEGHAAIQLLAVRAEARGRGVADRLLREANRRIQSLGADTVDVVTQSSNIAAQRLYQKHGFRSSSHALWFHLWL